MKVIFRDTLRVDPRVRPSALQLLSYPVLKEGEFSLSLSLTKATILSIAIIFLKDRFLNP